MKRSVQSIYPPPSYHWVGNGFRVHNFFPSNTDIGMYRMSPWFLMDYASKFDFPPGKEPRGVAVHPHRGIETVTREEIEQAYDDYHNGKFGQLD